MLVLPPNRESKEITLQFRSITASTARPLREAVLYTPETVDFAYYEGDDAATSCHFGAYDASQLVAIVSILQVPAPFPTPLPPPHFRLRGLAVLPQRQGQGIGFALMQHLLHTHQQQHPDTLIWCNVRVPQQGFYLKLGFTTIGDEFVYNTRPHVQMSFNTK